MSTPDTALNNSLKSGWWRLPWLLLAFLTAAVLVGWFYNHRTRVPSDLVIAGGPDQGRYDVIAEALAEELRLRLNIEVRVDQTQGSLENLERIANGKADLCLYQPGTVAVLERQRPEITTVHAAFISNLHIEHVVLLVRADLDDSVLNQLAGKAVGCHMPASGDYASLLLLLSHLDLEERDVTVVPVDYAHLEQAFVNREIDIAIVTAGLEAPILRQLASSEVCRPVSLPYRDAFQKRMPAVEAMEIPPGYFRTAPTPVPAEPIRTIGIRAELLTSRDQPVRLIETVTEIVTDPEFQRRARLGALLSHGPEFATDGGEFPMHAGASHIHFPDLKPLLNPDFVEGTEGLRSFLFSILVAVWLAIRWFRKRRIRAQEHRLDRFVQRLLEIERGQLNLDDFAGGQDADALNQLLDQVTSLRQDALSTFSAHEINEDKAIDTFVRMCHALSDKINFKLSRQRLDQNYAAIQKLLEARMADAERRDE